MDFAQTLREKKNRKEGNSFDETAEEFLLPRRQTAAK